MFYRSVSYSLWSDLQVIKGVNSVLCERVIIKLMVNNVTTTVLFKDCAHISAT